MLRQSREPIEPRDKPLSSTPLRSVLCDPFGIAKWLLIVFAAAHLPWIIETAHDAVISDPSTLFLLFAMLLWYLGPPALAAWLTSGARSKGEAWLFVAAEVMAVASTTWFWIYGKFIAGSHATKAVATVRLMVLPATQFLAILIYALGIIAVADLMIADKRPERPRIKLLIALSIACAPFLIVLRTVHGCPWS